jgi:hypothetical protein
VAGFGCPSRRYQLPGRRNGLPLDLGPFDIAVPDALTLWSVPMFPNHASMATVHTAEDEVAITGRLRMFGALYAVARDQEPWWHQLVFEYPGSIDTWDEHAVQGSIWLWPVHDERARVAAEFVSAGDERWGRAEPNRPNRE